MPAKERVTAFLVERESTNFCDRCLAHALGIDPSTAYRAAMKAGQLDRFVREYGPCAVCGESRLITRAAAEGHEAPSAFRPRHPPSLE